MDFFKDLFDSFIPHEENAYKPYFFRTRAVLFTAFFILVLALGVFLLQSNLIKNQSYLAAVISSVLIDLTNTDRHANGLDGLALNPILTEAAQLKASDMAAKGYFAHTSPAGLTPWYWFKQAGYSFEYAGENLAVRFSDSIDVETAWMNSPAHRANILNSHFTEIGIATAEGMYNGQRTIFVVQMFGQPAPAVGVATSDTAPLTIGGTPAPTAQKTAIKTSVKSPASAPVALAEVVKPASNVEGTSTGDAPKVIMQDDTFIAVKNSAPAAVLGTSTPPHVSIFTVLFTSPKTVVGALYALLAALILLGLVVMIVVEIRHQHPWNVALGIGLIVLMMILFYVWEMYFPGPLAIL